ncbi:hypothetical protein UFOVP1608_4 [uncultured Caudovirales phage]|uniref:Uncharacterized protein n=1 Tax=uncultured Caudovirales phage TaxID=2100421 RepID=A0A6J5SRY8_9CAUD|nr:hypothetical protein UFOVP1608_4 [uncultured Caudovirales phage]
MGRATPRNYLPLDCRFFDDERVAKAGERAAYLYLAILCAIKQDNSDGMISIWKIKRLGVDKWKPRLERLVSVGLLLVLTDDLNGVSEHDPAYGVPAWSRWNLSAHEIQARRDNGREAAQRRWNRDGSPNGSPIKNPLQNRIKSNQVGSRDIHSLGSLVENLAKGIGEAE